MSERDYFIALNMVYGLGPVKTGELLRHFKRPSRIFKSSADDLSQVEGVGEELALRILAVPQSREFRQELDMIEKNRVHVLTIEDEAYPALLREIYDPPVILYLKGNLEALNRPRIAIVGCRRASFYGLQQAERLGAALGLRGLCVVSGLARGIDTAAHRGALKFSGITAAVLGSGLLEVYPPENVGLAENIIDKGGLLISEFVLQAPPHPANFPRRNRIISGLCRGVVVVEAARRSGSLITANLALSQNRDVYAVPGTANSVNAQGTNKLIKDGAKLVEGVDDIIDDLTGNFPAYSQNPAVVFSDDTAGLSPGEKKLLSLLDSEPVHIDELVEASGQKINRVYSDLFGLQVKGFVKEIEGKRFVKKGGE